MKHDIAFFEDTHEYLVDGALTPSVTEILQPLSNRGHANVNPSVLEYARNRGTAVHEALEAIDLDLDPDVSPEILPYIRAYEEWCSIYRPTWLGIEQIVYNENHGYIGTLDRVGYLNDTELAIVDLKTSNPTKEAKVSVCLQTMAYELAYCTTLPDDKEKPKINRYGLFLKSDGSFSFQDCRKYEDKNGFHAYEAWIKMLEMNKVITKLLATGKGKK